MQPVITTENWLVK